MYACVKLYICTSTYVRCYGIFMRALVRVGMVVVVHRCADFYNVIINLSKLAVAFN